MVVAVMLNSLKSYQSARRLPADGVMNPATWEALNVDSDFFPVLFTYIIAKKDVVGPSTGFPTT